MSQENVDVIRKSLDAFAKRGVAGMAEYLHPDINWRAMEGAPDDVGEMVGIPAAMRYGQEWIDMFEGFTSVPEELLDVGDGRVVAVQLIAGRAKASGIETQLRYALVYTLREGKIVRVREYATRSEALKAAGLEE